MTIRYIRKVKLTEHRWEIYTTQSARHPDIIAKDGRLVHSARADKVVSETVEQFRELTEAETALYEHPAPGSD